MQLTVVLEQSLSDCQSGELDLFSLKSLTSGAVLDKVLKSQCISNSINPQGEPNPT